MFIEAVVFIAIIMFGWNYYNGQLDRSEQNLKVYRGQIEELELKNGDLVTSRDSYIARASELEDLLNISRKEVRDLKNTLGSKIAYISKLESQMSTGPIIIQKDSIVYIEKSKIESHFKYNDEWLSFKGITRIDGDVGSTQIDGINIFTPLKVGITDDYQIFVQTPNPYITFNEIEGAVIDGSKFAPKKKRLSWGVQVGFGTMYDVIKKDIAIGPYGGLGVEFNF
jgi:hypothetical protein